MSTKNILIVSGSHLSANDLEGWKGFETTFAETDERAIELANRQSFHMAVIDSTSHEVNIKKLSAVLPLLQEEMEVLYYKGEPLNELKNKVAAFFTQQRNERIKRFLLLDASAMNMGWHLPAFSAN
ncbi:MAG TPA: hypothetical protein VEV15_03145 [Flavisolibacter sp.]|nr:hypothetical protein [Flavisolibacter sp.]